MLVTILLMMILWILFFLMEWAAAAFYPHSIIIEFFPDDVKEKAKDHKPPFHMAPIIGWALEILIITGMIGAFIYGGWDGIQRNYTYIRFLVRFLIMIYGMKAFDILFFDYFILTKTRFFQHFYPETDGCAGWKQFGYNRKEQIKQLIIALPVAAVTAWICDLISR
ncbi:MAG: hypothetical protein IJ079_09410 [Lachnospiraceae bacterium]|nr:hypothetical protein [Lachnospiraceae bacterium]